MTDKSAEAEKRRTRAMEFVCREFGELDELMQRFDIRRCVIDAMPDIHATRAFARRHVGRVWLNYFQESQRGKFRWDQKESLVYENRTEALDLSRQLVRDKKVILPRRQPMLEVFAAHMAADAKRLEEDEETGEQEFRYVRGGPDHFSLAFTYDCVAWSRDRWGTSSGCFGKVPFPRIVTGPW